MRRSIGILLAAALLTPAAAAELQWNLKKKDGRPYLEAFSGEEEGDTEFWALCRKDRAIELGIGADSMVGKGEGERVTLTLKSAGKSATLTGLSRESVNVEMTAGRELRAVVSARDPVFAVLATGKPISVTGSVEKAATWTVAGLKAKVAAFLAACK